MTRLPGFTFRLPLRTAGLLLLVCSFTHAWGQGARSLRYQSAGRAVTYEVFEATTADAPLLILLPGTSGPEAPFYRSQAAFFAKEGYTTLLLHYFDAAASHAPSTGSYRAWAAALAELVRVCGETPAYRTRSIFVVGYSLGASVALAAGSQLLPVQAIADWYGSLPDDFFAQLKGMPPLLILHGARDGNIPVLNASQLVRLCGIKDFDCENHIYPDQSHGFDSASTADADQRTLAFFSKHQH